MTAGEEVVGLLRSIDASLKSILALRKSGAGAAAGGNVASDRDLDGKYGDPKLAFNPRDWTGPSFKGSTFSKCPPDLLDLVAEMYDYFAKQAEEKKEVTAKGKPVAEFKRADAARARGWAKRMRDGSHPMPESGAAAAPGWSDEPEFDSEGGWK